MAGEEMKEYLGDSVYAELTKYGEIILTTDNGDGPNNTIILESDTIWALNKFLLKVKQL
jgi:hypothetical protein